MIINPLYTVSYEPKLLGINREYRIEFNLPQSAYEFLHPARIKEGLEPINRLFGVSFLTFRSNRIEIGWRSCSDGKFKLYFCCFECGVYREIEAGVYDFDKLNSILVSFDIERNTVVVSESRNNYGYTRISKFKYPKLKFGFRLSPQIDNKKHNYSYEDGYFLKVTPIN